MNTKTIEIQHFDHVSGLGNISFSPELIANMIKSVLKEYPKYIYKTHSIARLQANYYEVSVELSLPSKDLHQKEVDHIQKELLTMLRQSLRLTCALFINIKND